MASDVDPLGKTFDLDLDVDTGREPTVGGGGDPARALAKEKARAALLGFAGPPPRVGRYRVIDRLGAGAMGVVYRARDEELDRDVAVKVLSAERTSADDVARLRREARALARINHPNVVAVFEVGEHGGQLFIAMELVPGRSLTAWLQDSPPRERILDAFTQAGRGLAAAHGVELVHRDFKPDNVLVGDDSRVRVVDFGLARSEADTSGDIGRTDEHGPSATAITAEGKIAGTPAYMAPEQWRGEPADSRTDQFAFCVALYEALFGQRPIKGDSLPALRLAAGEVDEDLAPPEDRLGRRLWPVLRRGLALDRDDRWPSMDALLEAIAAATRSRSGAWIAAAAAVAATAAIGAAWVLRPGPCERRDAAEAAAMVWSPRRAERIQTAFAATQLPHADAAWTQAVVNVDTRVQALVDARVEACRVHARGEVQDAFYDRQVACFNRVLEQTGALLDVLAAPTEPVVSRAVEASESLLDPARCLDAGFLDAEIAPPADAAQSATVAALRRRLAAARALDEAGMYETARADLGALEAEAEASGYAPLLAEVEVLYGSVARRAGEAAAAADLLERAYFTAQAAEHDRAATEAALSLAFLHGVDTRDFGAAQTWIRHAETADGTAHDDRLAAQLASTRGVVARRSGDPEAAVAFLDEALALTGPGTAYRAAVLNNKGLALGDAQRFAAAEQAHREALELRTQLLGPSHPDVASSKMNLAIVLVELDRIDEARAEAEASLAIKRAVFGDAHPGVGRSLIQLGNAYMKGQQLDEARAAYEESVRIIEAASGPSDPELSHGLTNLGLLYLQQGEPERALTAAERAWTVLQAAYGDAHPKTIRALNNTLPPLDALGRSTEAEDRLRKAIALVENAGNEEAVTFDTMLYNLGLFERDKKHWKAALDLFERAATLRRKKYGDEHPRLYSVLRDTAVMRIALGEHVAGLAGLEEALALAESLDRLEPSREEARHLVDLARKHAPVEQLLEGG